MRKWTRVGVTALLVLIALLALGIPLWASRAGLQLESLHAAIREAGYPVTLEELDAWYEWPPAAENGAAYAEAAFALFNMRALTPEAAPAVPLLGDAKLTRTDPLSPEARATIEALVADNAAALDLLRQAARQSRSRYSVDFTGMAPNARDHRASLTQGAKLLAIEAILAAENGDAEKAAAGMEEALRVVETISDEPDLIAQSSRTVDQMRWTLDVLNRLLHRVTLNDEQLARLARAISLAESHDTFYRGLVGQRCQAEADFDRMRTGMASSMNRGVIGQIWARSGLITLDRLWYLRGSQDLVQAALAPVDERVDRVEALRNRLEHPPAYARLSTFWMGGQVDTALMPIQAAAYLRSARTALAVERYRLAHGALPERLDDLVPTYLDAVPRDPYGKGPILYRRRDKGYIVYSVGWDRTDSGGVDRAEAKDHGIDWGKADFGFIVER